MKLPTVFIPERDTDRKIEELKQNPEPKKPKHVTIEELLENNMEILYGHPNTPGNIFKRDKLEYHIFEKIIKDTFSGKIDWKEDFNIPERYTANVTVFNYQGEIITIPILFCTIDKEKYSNGIWGFLYLGNEEGTCRNTWNEDVRRLATKYFKIKVKKTTEQK